MKTGRKRKEGEENATTLEGQCQQMHAIKYACSHPKSYCIIRENVCRMQLKWKNITRKCHKQLQKQRAKAV